MAEGARFTAWFSATERRALDRAAAAEESTANYIVRKALRRYVGRDAMKEAAQEVMDDVTGVTGNN